jgi:hypothetical protein
MCVRVGGWEGNEDVINVLGFVFVKFFGESIQASKGKKWLKTYAMQKNDEAVNTPEEHNTQKMSFFSHFYSGTQTCPIFSYA